MEFFYFYYQINNMFAPNQHKLWKTKSEILGKKIK